MEFPAVISLNNERQEVTQMKLKYLTLLSAVMLVVATSLAVAGDYGGHKERHRDRSAKSGKEHSH